MGAAPVDGNAREDVDPKMQLQVLLGYCPPVSALLAVDEDCSVEDDKNVDEEEHVNYPDQSVHDRPFAVLKGRREGDLQGHAQAASNKPSVQSTPQLTLQQTQLFTHTHTHTHTPSVVLPLLL